MASKIFLDANIVLDFILQRDAGYKDAKGIVEYAVNGKLSAYITPAIVHIAGYFLKKTYGIQLTKKLLLSFLTDIKIIDISYIITIQALNSEIPDIEDSLQYYSALHHNLDYFISRDKPLKNFALPQLPVIHPKDYVKEHIY